MMRTSGCLLGVAGLIAIAALLFFAAFSVPAAVAQQADCGDTYTVVSGDTLNEIAQRCGTSVSALVRANPQIEDPGLVFPGQVLVLPGAIIPDTGGDPDTYIVQSGDTLSEIAVEFDTSVEELLALNPQIEDPSLIFPGQRIAVSGVILPPTGPQAQLEVSPVQGSPGTTVTITGSGYPANTPVQVAAGVVGAEPQVSQTVTTGPNGAFTAQLTIPQGAEAGREWAVQAFTQTGGGLSLTEEFLVTVPADERTYIVRPGDTLSEIAAAFDTSVQALLEANPQIEDPGLIFVGQRILLPEAVIIPGTGGGGEPVATYTVRRGDTLSEIAVRFDTSVSELLNANPGIQNPDLIFPGQVLTIP